MNRTTFFDAIRNDPFKGLSGTQVSGISAILDEWERRGLSDLRWLAYMLATAYHETAHTMQPIAEYGHGKGHSYGKPGRNHGQAPYGRGYVQLTHDDNYERADHELGLGGTLIANYERALNPAIAAQIMFGGMIGGWFTGKKLADYFNGGMSDPTNARRIINALDKAQTIAGYFRAFYNALLAARTASPAPISPPAPAPAPEPPPPVHDDNGEDDPVKVPPAKPGFDLMALFQTFLKLIGRKT